MNKIKKLLNKFFFLLYFKFLYKPNYEFNEVDEIAVIGRGKSANYYFEKFQNSPKIVALVNFTDQDLKEIDIQVLKNKDIFLFFNIEGNPLSLKYLLSLNIKGLMRTSNDDYGLYKKRKDYKRLNILQKLYLDRLPKYPKHLNDFMYLGNGGLISIVYMINYFKPKRVLLFGFNFYQSKMISNSSFSNSVNEDSTVLRKAGVKLIQNFIHICNLFNNIEFQRYDDTQIENVSNLKQINTGF